MPPTKKARTEAALVLDPDVVARAAELVGIRRHIHQSPELSFEETATSAFILDKLKAIDGVEQITTGLGQAPSEFQGATPSTYTRAAAGTGITAMIIGGGGAGPCVLFRADIDALPIQETSTRGYASIRPGVMHACGHDGHVAMLLVAAEVVASRRAGLKGSIKLCFQPAEEFGGGAKCMVQDGVLNGVDEVYGIHLITGLRTGTIGVKDGPLMAAPDKFTITIVGKGGHGAMPDKTVDAMQCAAQISVALQTIVSRETDPLDAAVVSIGKMENDEGSLTCGCGHTFNVICGKVVMHGTSRSFSDATQASIRASIDRIAVNVAKAMGATASVKFDDVYYGFPATVNSHHGAATMRAAALGVVGEAGIKSGRDIMTMGGEDFSYFLKERTGCFVFVGATAAGADPMPHHHDSFDIDEGSLSVGASLWTELANSRLGA